MRNRSSKAGTWTTALRLGQVSLWLKKSLRRVSTLRHTAQTSRPHSRAPAGLARMSYRHGSVAVLNPWWRPIPRSALRSVYPYGDKRYDVGSVSKRLAKAANLRLLGKSPANFYLWLNKRIWQRLPSRMRDLRLIRSYGAWLHTLVCLRASRQQHFGTFFLRNRPALELMRRLAEQKPHGADFENCRIGLQYRSRGLFDPLDHPLSSSGPESRPLQAWIFQGKSWTLPKAGIYNPEHLRDGPLLDL